MVVVVFVIVVVAVVAVVAVAVAVLLLLLLLLLLLHRCHTGRMKHDLPQPKRRPVPFVTMETFGRL